MRARYGWLMTGGLCVAMFFAGGFAAGRKRPTDTDLVEFIRRAYRLDLCVVSPNGSLDMIVVAEVPTTQEQARRLTIDTAKPEWIGRVRISESYPGFGPECTNIGKCWLIGDASLIDRLADE